MGLTRGRGGVVTAVLSVSLSLAAAVGAIVAGPELVAPLAGPAPTWRPGSSPPPPVPVLAGAAVEAPAPTAGGVEAALAPLLGAAGLGGNTAVSVIDIATGSPIYAKAPDTVIVPASLTKLVTAATVLAARGPGYRFATKAVAGANPGEVVLVGGGDPTLTAGAGGTYPGAARLDELAAQVKQALGGTAPSKVSYDGSLFSGAPVNPGWDDDVVSDGYGAATTALMIDGARVNPREVRAPTPRVSRPELTAAQAFARALGLPVTAVAAGGAPPGGRELGVVWSPPLLRVVDVMLTESDNVLAEALARQVAVAKGQPASYAGAAAAMKTVLTELGVPVTGYALSDGSGLSRANKLSPALITAMLALAARAERPELHGVFAGLPVAAYSGTLRDRYRNPAAGATAAGYVRAKTGTLTGVSAIAGIVVDADGRVLAFAVLADSVPNNGTIAAQEALDRIAAALAACGCR